MKMFSVPHGATSSTLVVVLLFGILAVSAKPTPDGHHTFDLKKAKIAVEELSKLQNEKGNMVIKEEDVITEVKNGVKSEINGRHETVKDHDGKVKADVKQVSNTKSDGSSGNGKTITKTNVNIPSHNIRDSFIQESNSDNTVEKKSAKQNQMTPQLQKVDFNPVELAKYIDETGDEEGIVLAINELLENGLLTRQKALEYLQRIKLALEMMRTSEEHRGNELNEIRRPDKSTKGRLFPMQNSNGMSEDYPNMRNGDRFDEDYVMAPPNEEEQRILDKLHVADYLYTQYEMQVIYQLFKDLFKSKLLNGNANDVQLTAERFASFLDNEKEFGKISEELEAEITETMTSAMIASLAESQAQSEVMRRYQLQDNVSNQLQVKKSGNTGNNDSKKPAHQNSAKGEKTNSEDKSEFSGKSKQEINAM